MFWLIWLLFIELPTSKLVLPYGVSLLFNYVLLKDMSWSNLANLLLFTVIIEKKHMDDWQKIMNRNRNCYSWATKIRLDFHFLYSSFSLGIQRGLSPLTWIKWRVVSFLNFKILILLFYQIPEQQYFISRFFSCQKFLLVFWCVPSTLLSSLVWVPVLCQNCLILCINSQPACTINHK